MQLKSKNYHSISVSFPRQFMVNLLYPSAINLETIITINWLRSPNQTLPNIAIRYLRLNSVDFVLFGFCCVVCFSPQWFSDGSYQLPCVFSFLLASFVRLEDVHDSLSPASGSPLPWSMAFLPPAICHFNCDVTPSRDLPVFLHHYPIEWWLRCPNHCCFLIRLAT